MDCNIYVAKTKALISFAVTAKLICIFVFTYDGFLMTLLIYWFPILHQVTYGRPFCSQPVALSKLSNDIIASWPLKKVNAANTAWNVKVSLTPPQLKKVASFSSLI